MTQKVKVVCENCYMLFEMSSNAKLRLCPACKAEEEKLRKRKAARKKYHEKNRKRPAYTISDVLDLQQVYWEKTGQWLSYGKMVKEIERQC